jgi:hypothetical protein
MSLVLDLPPDLELELAAEAARLRLSLSDYVVRVLATGRLADAMPSNGAELVAYWRHAGVVGTRTEIADALGHARALRQQAERRERS